MFFFFFFLLDEIGRSNTQQSAAVFPRAFDVPMLPPDWWLRGEVESADRDTTKRGGHL